MDAAVYKSLHGKSVTPDLSTDWNCGIGTPEDVSIVYRKSVPVDHVPTTRYIVPLSSLTSIPVTAAPCKRSPYFFHQTSQLKTNKIYAPKYELARRTQHRCHPRPARSICKEITFQITSTNRLRFCPIFNQWAVGII